MVYLFPSFELVARLGSLGRNFLQSGVLLEGAGSTLRVGRDGETQQCRAQRAFQEGLAHLVQPARPQEKEKNRASKEGCGDFPPSHCSQTQKYNSKIRAGRGFTLEELKAAGISKKLAPTVGIAVDHRRKNKSLESVQANVARLNSYKAKLIIFPRRSRKVKAGDSATEELASATQVQGPVFPIQQSKPVIELVPVTDELKSAKAYSRLRIERMNAKLVDVRKKRAAEAEKDEK